MTNSLGLTVTGNYFQDRAMQLKQRMLTIPLKDNSEMKILSGENTLDFFKVQGGVIQGMRGAAGKNRVNNSQNVIKYLQKMAVEGIDVLKELSKIVAR